jgi:hypothetical protein
LGKARSATSIDVTSAQKHRALGIEVGLMIKDIVLNLTVNHSRDVTAD